MSTIAEIRQKYPQYQDMPDDALADALHRKFYSDMPKEEFFAKVGLQAKAAPQEPSTWDTVKDVAAAGASGIARGAADLVGFPGTVGDAINYGLSSVLGLPQLPESPLSGASLRSAASEATGGATNYRGKTIAGKYAGAAGEFIPGAAAFGGASIGNVLRYGVLPGVASEAAGQATEGTVFEPFARAGAALVAPMAPSILGRVITPNPASAERQAAAAFLRSEGVTPTAGQLSGNKSLKALEAELGGGRAADMMDDQARAFTDAVMRRAGANGLADPDNMVALSDRLSNGYKTISARNTLSSDPQLGNDIGATLQQYERILPTDQRQVIQNYADDIIQKLTGGNGKMAGTDYQTIRSRLGKTAYAARNSDTEFSDALYGLQGALDDAMTRSISPQDAQEWATLNRQYGNSKVIEKAAAGAGENAAQGMISPAKLRQAAAAGRNGQYARGKGDFDKLARAGEALLKPLPDSGTTARLNAKMLGNILGVAGAGGGAAAGPTGAVLGAVTGFVAPTVAGRVLMSNPVQKYLSNQLLQPTRLVDPRAVSVVQELLSQARARQLEQRR